MVLLLVVGMLLLLLVVVTDRGLKLCSVIYRAATLIDWLLEAGPGLIVDVDVGVSLHSFGPEPATRRPVPRAQKQAGAGES